MATRAPARSDDAHGESWRTRLRSAFRDLDALLDYLEIGPRERAALGAAANRFGLLVPRGLADRMRKGDPHDPLLRQFLALAREREAAEGFEQDPLQEQPAARGGLIRKYAGRALLVTTAACPVHCRYCFRRHFPYAEHTASRDDWSAALAELDRHADVSEIVLSGGDPLSLSNRRLAELVAALDARPRITTLRIHSRFPIVIPERVDHGLLQLLERTRLDTVVVVHCNHAREIDASVDAALAALRAAGVMLLNQSVLLHGVNDDVAALAALSRRLLRAGVLPYYLHELDPVAGAAHFAVPRERALALVDALRGRLPGYLVPRFVREIPGEPSKTPLA